jgi:hypothetical protein
MVKVLKKKNIPKVGCLVVSFTFFGGYILVFGVRSRKKIRFDGETANGSLMVERRFLASYEIVNLSK